MLTFFTIFFIMVFLIPIILIICILYWTADFRRPDLKISKSRYDLTRDSDGFKECPGGWLFRNRYGFWEAYVSGTPEDRGGAMGSMCRNLLAYQEEAFIGFIKAYVKSFSYLRILYWLTIVFIRRMADNVPEEYRKEIYAASEFSSHTYDIFCDSYVRQLSYHAAHDIGHFMQDYMLVGCTSFAVWGDRSKDGRLLLARNFDFCVGDDFSRNRIILFSEPDTGYRYASITWPGMIGVVSGMNEKGLTITLNASKGRIPLQATAPVSILARHILQYSSNIAEAMEIARNFKTIVPEIFTIGSRADGKAAVIEKAGKVTSLYERDDDMLICTNHFQSDAFKEDKHNIKNIQRSDSPYRYDRVNELILEKGKIGIDEAVAVLRDRKGKGGVEMGMGNPKAINQLIAHHSVIFSPEELKMWVSTSPWQCGEFICYDLNEVFGSPEPTGESRVKHEFNIPAEQDFTDDMYKDMIRYRELSRQISDAISAKEVVEEAVLDDFAALNPDYYETYEIIGDYRLSRDDKKTAVENWKAALGFEVPTLDISENIRKKIKKNDKKSRNRI